MLNIMEETWETIAENQRNRADASCYGLWTDAVFFVSTCVRVDFFMLSQNWSQGIEFLSKNCLFRFFCRDMQSVITVLGIKN